jgi:hypothetical protein
MVYIHDTRDKATKHQNVDEYLIAQGHKVVRSKMFVGDVTLLSDQSVCIDLKRNLQEVAVNVGQDHARFKRELERAQEYGIKLIFLVEHGGAIKTLEDVQGWVNPRLKEHPLALTGPRLYKIMLTMQNKYGIEWHFCDKRCTGKRIIELLGREVPNG